MRTDSIPKPAEEWKHYKGTVYTVVGLARSCVNQSIQVVYFHGSKMWVRSLNEWMELLRDVEAEGTLYDGPRFTRVSPDCVTDCPGP